MTGKSIPRKAKGHLRAVTISFACHMFFLNDTFYREMCHLRFKFVSWIKPHIKYLIFM